MTKNNLIDLTKAKAQRRKQFLQRYGRRLDCFIAEFIDQHLNIEFADLALAYQAQQSELEHQSWDYLDLRELVVDLVHESITKMLYQNLCQEPWFDKGLISQDQLTERCIPIFMFGIGSVANQ